MNDTLFKNTTKYDKESLLKLQNKVMLKWIILGASIIILISLAVGVPLILFVNEFVGGALIIIGFLGGIVFLPYFIKNIIKKQQFLNEGEKYINSFEFFRDKFSIKSSTLNSKNSNDKKIDVYYNDIYKIIISNLYINIFISPSESLILDKRGMTKGTADDLIDLLSKLNLKVKLINF